MPRAGMSSFRPCSGGSRGCTMSLIEWCAEEPGARTAVEGGVRDQRGPAPAHGGSVTARSRQLSLHQRSRDHETGLSLGDCVITTQHIRARHSREPPRNLDPPCAAIDGSRPQCSVFITPYQARTHCRRFAGEQHWIWNNAHARSVHPTRRGRAYRRDGHPADALVHLTEARP